MSNPNDKRQLFGGAIEIELPRRFMDVSDFREVPSHQEVFADQGSDQSFVIELLDKASPSDSDAATFHFETLAEDNGVNPGGASVLHVQDPTPDFLPHFSGSNAVKKILFGQQRVSKYKETAENLETDILITLNEPIAFDPNSSSAPKVEYTTNPALTQEVFVHALKTFNIKDYSLFG